MFGHAFSLYKNIRVIQSQLHGMPLSANQKEVGEIAEGEIFVEGEIAGIDDSGRLTKRYSQAIYFVIMIDCHSFATSKKKASLRIPSGGKFLTIAPNPGDYIVAIRAIDGSDGIACVPISKTVMTFQDFANSVGRVVFRPVTRPDKSIDCIVETV